MLLTVVVCESRMLAAQNLKIEKIELDLVMHYDHCGCQCHTVRNVIPFTSESGQFFQTQQALF